MPSRPDLRDLVTSVRDAFADADRETLLDVLTFVVQEYVVDGPPPMLMHQAEKLSDLSHLSFAQLISALQTRLEAPELSLFAVDGEQVTVRVGGVMQPLVVARAPAPVPVVVEPPPRPQAGVQIVEMPTMPRPASAQPAPAPAASAPAQAPRPTQGMSLRGRPSGEGAPLPGGGAPQSSAPSGAPSAGSPAASGGAAPAAAAVPAEKPKDNGDDASARFSLLELD